MTLRTYVALRHTAGRWLQRGVSVILDGSFGDPRQRRLARQLAERHGADFRLILVTAPDDVRGERLARRAREADAVSDADWSISQAMAAAFKLPHELPQEEVLEVDGQHGLPDDYPLLWRAASAPAA
jgi:predicted kinase